MSSWNINTHGAQCMAGTQGLMVLYDGWQMEHWVLQWWVWLEYQISQCMTGHGVMVHVWPAGTLGLTTV